MDNFLKEFMENIPLILVSALAGWKLGLINVKLDRIKSKLDEVYRIVASNKGRLKSIDVELNRMNKTKKTDRIGIKTPHIQDKKSQENKS